MTVRRTPPPPPLVADPAFNRWLHDITAFIASSGGIDPSAIPDYSALQSQVSTNTANIAVLSSTVTTHTTQISALQSTVATHTTQISTLNTQVSTLNGQMTAANAAIAALQGNAVVRSGSGAPSSGLGANGDWYADVVAKHIYVKSGGAYILIV